MSTSTDTLLQQIKATLAALPKDAKQSTKAYDLYEVLVFGAVRRAACALNAQVDLVDANGNAATRYLFRSSPGPLANPSQPFIHAEIHIPGTPPLEVHTGIWIVGKSGTPHECDCVVITKAEADSARSAGYTPRWGQVVLFAECKHYVVKPVGRSDGRAFLGLNLELGGKYGTFVASKSAAGVDKLVRYRKRSASMQLSPDLPKDLDKLVRRFQTRFEAYRKNGEV